VNWKINTDTKVLAQESIKGNLLITEASGYYIAMMMDESEAIINLQFLLQPFHHSLQCRLV
jgi:hypothetical protein